MRGIVRNTPPPCNDLNIAPSTSTYNNNNKYCIYLFRWIRQLKTFANKADSVETAHNELSYLKYALFAT